MFFILKAIVLYFTSIILLRWSGRKSLSQMTIGTTVVMISIGSVIVNPLVDKGVLRTVIVIAIFIGVLVTLEFLETKIPALQTLMVGKPVVVVTDGQVHARALKKLRMTEEKLNMRLRAHGIASLREAKTITIEPNGQIGYELAPGARPLTVDEFKRLMGMTTAPFPSAGEASPDLFALEREDSARARG